MQRRRGRCSRARGGWGRCLKIERMNHARLRREKPRGQPILKARRSLHLHEVDHDHAIIGTLPNLCRPDCYTYNVPVPSTRSALSGCDTKRMPIPAERGLPRIPNRDLKVDRFVEIELWQLVRLHLLRVVAIHRLDESHRADPELPLEPERRWRDENRRPILDGRIGRAGIAHGRTKRETAKASRVTGNNIRPHRAY